VPGDAKQNLDLALQVILASSVPLPTKVKSLTAQDLIDNNVALFLFCETLRQIQKLNFKPL